MNLKFTKMQATGNDYIFVNLFDADDFKIFNETNWSQIAIRLSDRHFGIGSDGLILICPSDIADCSSALRQKVEYVHFILILKMKCMLNQFVWIWESLFFLLVLKLVSFL